MNKDKLSRTKNDSTIWILAHTTCFIAVQATNSERSGCMLQKDISGLVSIRYLHFQPALQGENNSKRSSVLIFDKWLNEHDERMRMMRG